jgi:hypothetical protein
MPKQKLSAAAARRKAARDLRYANSPDRKAKRRDSQKQKRKAEKNGKSVKGKDFDHKTRTWKSVKSNRGNGGKGTKKESGANYKVPAKQKR